jgi:hypothetical protein
MTATHEDAAIVVQLVRWGAEIGLDEATSTLFAEGFDPASASDDDPAVRKVLGFGETVSTLVKHGVLDEALILDLIWIAGVWTRVAPAAAHARARFGEPRLYENFEALAKRATS